MYAVITTGGKQYRVEDGDVLEVERLAAVGDTVHFVPVLVVDAGRMLATRSELASATVTAEVVN